MSQLPQSNSPLEVLIVDDDEVTRNLLKEVLTKESFTCTLAESGEAALVSFGAHPVPIVLSDVRMLDLDGMALLKKIRAIAPETVVILMTGFGSMETAIQAIQSGAFDYMSKPFDLAEIRALLGRARDHIVSLKGDAHPKTTRPATGKLAPKALIGKSPKLVEVYKTIARAALGDSTVLISGESGTGKELVARAVHENGPRSKAGFLAINCGALSEGLLESELFGHIRGSFTGATGDKRGIFEEAHGGTLFLDEIGDVPLPLQVKLLRVLQEGEIRPVGSNLTKRVNVRVIAATHHDLGTAVKEGKFREDLYYRLKVIAIDLPPLRERKDDLPELITFFLDRFAQKSGRSISHVSDSALTMLAEYAWPGNVRELEHSIEHAVAMARSNVLHPEDFPPEVRARVEVQRVDSKGSLEDLEKQHILRVLTETGYNKTRTAEVLGIDRATLYRKAQRYGISLGDPKS